MTREELEQLRALRREIHNLEERIKTCEARAMATTQWPDGMPRAKQTADKVGINAADAAWYGIMLKNALDRYRSEFAGLWEFIEAIPDSEMRMIFRYRYIDGMTWQAVAFEIREHDESYPRRRHDRYIERAENAELEMVKY